jgi:hypothetical protein
MAQHHHAPSGSNGHAHRDGRAWSIRTLHKDWRVWLVVGLMLVGIVIYVLTLDESLVPLVIGR